MAMAKKGKELDFAGVRVQIDPLVLVRRVVTRQIPLLAVVALLGGIVTIGAYVRAPRIYRSAANILIRYEGFREDYLRKLLNVAAGYLGSDGEMMVILNELDLYPESRERIPYEVSIRRLRRDLKVKPRPRNIEIALMSPDPNQAQRVVAFTTERLLNRMAELNEGPFTRKLDAIATAMNELAPKRLSADNKLFAFKAKYPKIAMSVDGMFLDEGSPMQTLETEIRRAERDLSAARSGRIVRRKGRIRNTTKARSLAAARKRLEDAKVRYTESHPEVLRMQKEVDKLSTAVRAENELLDGRLNAQASPAERRRARVAAAEARLRQLLDRKIDLEKQVIAKPRLQRQWAELSMESSSLTSRYRELIDRRAKIEGDRLVAANNFQENFKLVDPARVPELPKEPNKNKYMVMGMAFTALLGFLIALLREGLRQTFVDSAEVEEQTGLQVFAELPDISEKRES